MSLKIRMLGAIVFAFLSLSFSLYSAFLGKYIQASIVLLAAVLITWIILFGPDSATERWYLALIPAALVVLSIFSAFMSSPLSNPNSHKENIDLLKRAIDANSCSPKFQPDQMRREAFNRLRSVLVTKCALQSYVDIQNITIDLSKAIYLGPVSSTLDSVYGEFNPKNEVTCIELAEQLDSLCPGFSK